MTSIETDLKQLIIETLQLEDLAPDDIDTDAPLFVEGLGLDSIDALELGVAIRKKYGIQLAADPDEARTHFASVRALATLIASQSK